MSGRKERNRDQPLKCFMSPHRLGAILFLAAVMGVQLCAPADCSEFPETAPEKAKTSAISRAGELLTGTWEYRQKNSASPTGYDAQGERLELRREDGSIRGLYFGLERTGDHGLWYTLVQIKDVEVSDEGGIAFTVPGRDFFSERPRSLEDIERLKTLPKGFTSTPLKFRGGLRNGELILRCASEAYECPDDVLIFRRVKWSGD